MRTITSLRGSHKIIVYGLALVFGLLQYAPLQAEERLDLSGTWRFRYDPSEYGEEKGWQEPGERTWNTLQVPMSYNAGSESWYNGVGWHRTSFQVPPGWSGGHLFLRFLGVNIHCKIWVNGELVGEHRYPYLPFEIDVTDAVNSGETNWLVVRVDNRIREQAVPDKNWDGWWNYGGIIREVSLVHRPQIYTRGAVIETRMVSENAWKLDFLLNTYNLGSDARGTFELTVRNPRGEEIWNGVGEKQILGGHTQYSFGMRMAEVEAWSPQSPALYSLRIITSQEAQNWQHEKIIRFGFRDIEIRGTQIYLNGKPLLIKGISRHEMYPGAGMTLSEERLRSDLEDIKELGCNMIRTAHYAQHPRFYDLADEMGFLVWTEIPAWKTSVEVLTHWRVWERSIKPQLESLVTNYQTHPSIIVWSVGNEFDSSSEQGMTYVERATNYIRGLDPTRLVTFASDEHRPRDNDRSFRFVDIIAINEYYGWYYGTIHDIGPTLDRLHQAWPGKPILIAETGAGSLLSIHNSSPPDAGKDYSVEYQVKFFRTHLNQIFDKSRRDFVAGALVWIYNDFPDPHRVGGGHPVQNNYVNSKGLVTQERERKPAYEAVQDIFRSLSP